MMTRTMESSTKVKPGEALFLPLLAGEGYEGLRCKRLAGVLGGSASNPQAGDGKATLHPTTGDWRLATGDWRLA
jgi:hypothetical protein